MSSLREIKERIGSVRGTLKITSAMKLVAAAKLRKAQRVIENMRPYEESLNSILQALPSGVIADTIAAMSESSSSGAAASGNRSHSEKSAPVAIIAISSNSSLCGGFNSNIIRKTFEVIKENEGNAKVFSVGRKMSDAMKKAGYPSEADYNDFVSHPSYDNVAGLSRSITARFAKGEFSKVILIYNRFKSSTSQIPTVEQYLPYTSGMLAPDKDNIFSRMAAADGQKTVQQQISSLPKKAAVRELDNEDNIFEPGAREIVTSLFPQVQTLKFYTAILDSAASEQAARTIAMQTATDNAEDLLGDLTLEYNKGRQQKITAEILDLLGGKVE